MSQGRAEEAGEAACAVPAAPYMLLSEPRTSTAAVPVHHSAFLRLRSLFRGMGNKPPNRLGVMDTADAAPGARGLGLLALTIPGITNIQPPGAGVKASSAEHGGGVCVGRRPSFDG